MANPPPVKGLRPVPPKEAEEEPTPTPAEIVEQIVKHPPRSMYVRPEHERMNFYPTTNSKKDFEDRVSRLAEEFRQATGRKIPQGAIHEAAITLVLLNWDAITEQFIG